MSPAQSIRVRTPVTPPLGEVLCVFPTTELIGGVQTSGRVAWEGLTANGNARRATMLCYCAKAARSGRISSSSTVHAGTKVSAALTALRHRAKPDIVLVWHIGLLKLLPFLHRMRAPVVVYLHGIEAWQPLDLVTRLLVGRADLLFTNSDYTWSRAVRANPFLANLPHQTVQLGLGDVAAQKELGLPSERPVALIISRLETSERYKGHREVIEAWPRVRAHMPDAELWVVGDGGLRPELQHLAGEGVRFMGTVSERKKADLLRECRALVMPSRKEGFGLVYLEAMRLGRPCLVSTLDAGHEVVGPPEAGLAANPTDANALTESMLRLLQPTEQWNSWSEHARLRYEAMYTAHAFQGRLISALAAFSAGVANPNRSLASRS